MSRWHRLKENTGAGAAWRTSLVVVVFAVIAVFGGLSERSLLPLIGYLAGLAIPFLARRALVARIEQVSPLLRFAGLALVGLAFVAGWTRDTLWSEAELPPGLLLTSLTTAAALYASTFFWLYSDPEVVRLD